MSKTQKVLSKSIKSKELSYFQKKYAMLSSEEKKAKALRLLYLANRSGALSWGNNKVQRALIFKEATLLLLAKDASDNQSIKFRRLASAMNIQSCVLSDRKTLGASLGDKPVAYLVLKDLTWANNFLALLEPLDRLEPLTFQSLYENLDLES